MRQTSRCANEAGLTLLEMLVVVSILALLAVALPPLGGGPPSAAETGRIVLHELRAARAEAIASARPVDVAIDLDRRRLATGAQAITLPETATLRVTSGRELRDENDRAVIRFMPDGSSSGGQIHVSVDGASTAIHVHWLTGSISHDET